MTGVQRCSSDLFLEAASRRNKDLRIIISSEKDINQDGVTVFPPIKGFRTPGYEKMMLYVPSILKLMKYVEDEDFDSIIVSTPGPLGIMGLICAKLMRIPVYGIYHTDFPRIALRVSDDPMFAEMALLLTRMFYHRVDLVFTTSVSLLEDINNLEIPSEKTRILEKWVDTNLFRPEMRDDNFWRTKATVKLLYVGQIAKNKDLDLLVQLYQHLAPRYKDFVLYCVGGGPYFNELSAQTASCDRFILTGPKYEEELAKAYASSDIFVYPGKLSTYNNVLVEAMASGLACIIINKNDQLKFNESDFAGIVAQSEENFIESVENLMVNEKYRQELGQKASEFATQRFSEEMIFNHFWQSLTQPIPGSNAQQKFHLESDQFDQKVVQLG